MHLGCISGRHFALDVTVRNRTTSTATILGGGGDQPLAKVMKRVAVQVRLASPPPKGDAFVTGLRAWSQQASESVAIPPGRDAWVQSNFLMRNCSLLHPGQHMTLNRGITLSYGTNGAAHKQRIAIPGGRIILSRATK